MKRGLFTATALAPLQRTEWLQHLGLLIASGLLLGAKEFAATQPALMAALIFVFSLPYLITSVVGRKAHFLYGSMLLGAVSYFLACYAFGIAVQWFPVLSVPLIVALWVVGQHLRRKQVPEAFPRTVFRAMHITVAVFTIWALVQAPDLLGGQNPQRWAAGVTMIAYAAVYLAHTVSGQPVAYGYVFAMFLIAGATLAAAAASGVGEHGGSPMRILVGSPLRNAWIANVIAAAIISFAGARYHRAKGYRWSRHFYLCCGGAAAVAIMFSLMRFSSFVMCLPLMGAVLWMAYGWLADAVGDVRLATTAERFAGKCFFLGSMALSIPLAPIMLVRPGNPYAAAAAVLFGLVFAWIAWKRREEDLGGRVVYLLPAAMFLGAGLAGFGPQLGATMASAAWAAAAPLAVMAGLAVLRRLIQNSENRMTGNGSQETGAAAKADESRLLTSDSSLVLRGLAEAAIFPAFFAWYAALATGSQQAALAGAACAGIVAIVAFAWLSERRFLRAIGPAMAGIVTAGALMLQGYSTAAWAACTAFAAAAGIVFVSARRDRTTLRTAANLAWLILSFSAFVIAAHVGTTPALYCATAVGAVAVLLSARNRVAAGRHADVGENEGSLERGLVDAVALLATIAAFVLGPFSMLNPFQAGLCLLVLSIAYGVAWGIGRNARLAITGDVLFSLALLMMILSKVPTIHAQLAAGSGIVLILFVLAATVRLRYPVVSTGSMVVGHLTAIVLAATALIEGWQDATMYLALATAPYVVIYAAMPRLHSRLAFRIGMLVWLSIGVLFILAASAGTPYREQIPWVAMLSLLWLILGYAVRRAHADGWSMAGYVCAAVLAILCGAVSLFAPAKELSWGVFLVNGIVFTSLFLILRQDIFVYLVTLALALMAYDWVKVTTTLFTQDVFFYLVIGLSIVALFYILPLMKKLLDRSGLVPMMSLFTWWGALAGAVPVAGLALILLSAYSLKITYHPKFCTSCHYMGDYYESWQHSAHKDVTCVDCHYEPTMRAAVQGKLQGMVQLVKYVSHSYTSKPHAMISNESCMRSDCHAGMDHSKEMLLFHGAIRFRHDRHLSMQPRGKKLNCVSCHGQTIQGTHISVSEPTCLTCHFYGRAEKPVAVGDCRSCHVLPKKDVNFAGQPFNHEGFLRNRKTVECVHCHSNVTQGDGAISPTRCQTCHLGHELQAGHLAGKLEDQAEFHLVHVSKGHFDCLQCHDEIEHGIHPMPQQLLTSGNCNNCHGGKRHSIQEAIYSGNAIKGMKEMPDLMYKAGVACDGCHTTAQLVKVGEMTLTSKRSGAKECSDCHAEGSYADLLSAWQAETKSSVVELQAAAGEVQALLNAGQAPRDQLTKAQELLASAEMKLSHVVLDGSFGAHNIEYVTVILDGCRRELKECRRMLQRNDE